MSSKKYDPHGYILGAIMFSIVTAVIAAVFFSAWKQVDAEHDGMWIALGFAIGIVVFFPAAFLLKLLFKGETKDGDEHNDSDHE